MTRANVPWPAPGTVVSFVGGVPSRFYPGPVDLEHEARGEIVDKPIFSDGATWVRVHVIGLGEQLLVPVENLRP